MTDCFWIPGIPGIWIPGDEAELEPGLEAQLVQMGKAEVS